MKNRFYGDVNDYIKYGILDILVKNYNALGINWYLTDDKHGNQNHGNVTRHIDYENKWSGHNPRIFTSLKNRVIGKQRNIRYCKEDNVIDFKQEFPEQLPDNATRNIYETLRNEWHTRAIKLLRECDLVFFDPDIGVINDLSKASAEKNSEYCLAGEIEDYDWCDWLIVQFLQRSRRYNQLKNNPIVERAQKRNKKVMVFIYGGMSLLYISDAVQVRLMCRVFEKWDTKIDTKILVP